VPPIVTILTPGCGGDGGGNDGSNNSCVPKFIVPFAPAKKFVPPVITLYSLPAVAGSSPRLIVSRVKNCAEFLLALETVKLVATVPTAPLPPSIFGNPNVSELFVQAEATLCIVSLMFPNLTLMGLVNT